MSADRQSPSMRLTAACTARSGVDHKTADLLQRMLNPLTGLSRSIGFMIRGRDEPRVITAGGEMTGVHVLRDRPDPGIGRYHIGGSGVFLNEPLVKCLGETAERYAQFVADVGDRFKVHVASHNDMIKSGRPTLPRDALERLFAPEQFKKSRFPYHPFDADMPIGWMPVNTITSTEKTWLPAQFLLVGYNGRPGEKKLNASVTTGTAVHRDIMRATRNALNELVQIDSAMGHWYSDHKAPQIILDRRTAAVSRLIARYFDPRRDLPRFHLLQNPDLPGFSVACVLRRARGFPSIGIGLGAGLQLNAALYAALTEAVGVTHMAKKALVDEIDQAIVEDVDPEAIYDLDSNVTYYARDAAITDVTAKFSEHDQVRATELSDDVPAEPTKEVSVFLDGFKNSGKRLFGLDLTTADLAALDLHAARVWSPDTLSLCLPSAPPLAHPRFAAYGGASNRLPHPYP